jgi:hypothetical protein
MLEQFLIFIKNYSKNMNKKILPVGEVLVRSEIAETPFICNLSKCKGACCTLESEYGAPLLYEEINKIDEILDTVKPYLSFEHVNEIERNGFYDLKHDELMIRSLNNKACVFVFYENGIAKCGIEKAFLDGKTEFKKPISCHLFPIRVSNFNGDILRFENFEECSPALEEGKLKNVTVAEFCEEPLKRLYGKEWYSKFKESIGR